MFFIFPTLLNYFITVMSAFLSLISDYRTRKIVLFTVWLFVSFRINVFWLMEQKRQNPIRIVINQLSFINIFVTMICLEIELLWTIFIEWNFGDVLCRITKWLQTTSLIISAGLILQIVIFLKYPEKSRKRIKKNVFIIWMAGLFFASPQLFIFGSYTVAPNNVTQCTVEQNVPESYNDIFVYFKLSYFAGSVIILLIAHSLLYCLFMGKKKRNFWSKHSEDKWRLMKIYLMMVFYTYCAFIALSILSLYIIPMGIIVEYFHYGLLQAGCLFSTFNPFLLRKILEKSASDNDDEIPSSSSSPPPFILVSIQLSDDPPPSSLDSVSVPLSDDNDRVSSSPPFNSVSIQLSDDLPSSSVDPVSVPLTDDNDGISALSSLNTVSVMLSGDETVAPDKERKRNTRHHKMKRLIVYNTLNPSVIV